MEQISFEQLTALVSGLLTRVSRLEQLLFLRPRFNDNQCNSNLSKQEIAQFFYILMDEKIFFFDSYDNQNNRKCFQKFIQDHFTYYGDRGEQSLITAISKEFSEAKGYSYNDKQLRFLDKLISLLQKRKSRLKE